MYVSYGYIQIKGVNILAELLQIKDLKVSVEEKQILKGIDLTINKGEIHVVMGCWAYRENTGPQSRLHFLQGKWLHGHEDA